MSVLLARRGEPVDLETLTEAVWPDPDNAPEWEGYGIRTQINQMRSQRGVNCIRTCGGARWTIDAAERAAPMFSPSYRPSTRRAA